MQRSGQLRHPLFVGSTDDHRPGAVLHQLLEGDDFAAAFALTGEHHVQGFVQHHFGASFEGFDLDVGMQRHPHLAAAGEDVDGAVVFVVAEVGAVGRRRSGQLLDLFAQRGDLLAGFPQGVGELFVLRYRLGELALGVEETLFERAHPFRGVLETSAERDDLLFHGLGLFAQLGDLGFVAGEPPFVLGLVDDRTSCSPGPDRRSAPVPLPGSEQRELAPAPGQASIRKADDTRGSVVVRVIDPGFHSLGDRGMSSWMR